MALYKYSSFPCLFTKSTWETDAKMEVTVSDLRILQCFDAFGWVTGRACRNAKTPAAIICKFLFYGTQANQQQLWKKDNNTRFKTAFFPGQPG